MSELYFAYGSNMSARRLAQRIPQASALGPASLAGRRLILNKPGRDGSGKANLVEDPASTVWGVLYQIRPEALPVLDGFEAGYRRGLHRVRRLTGEWVEAHSYIWTRATPELPAFDWYREHLLEGAREHGLPDHYLHQLESLRAQPDPRRREPD